jgi:hypothetical protein
MSYALHRDLVSTTLNGILTWGATATSLYATIQFHVDTILRDLRDCYVPK